MRQAMFQRIKSGYSPDEVNQYIAALAQENEQQKATLNTYEAKLREVTALANAYKAQSESDRLRLADVMMQANHTGSGIIEQAKQEASRIIADANAESGNIKSAAIEEIAQLKRKLDTELATIRETFSNITAATETSRQDILNMFQKVDSSSRNASSLLHIWHQNAPAPADIPITAAPPSGETPAGGSEKWLDDLQDILKNVQPPEKASEHPHDPYVGFGTWPDIK